jgi:hypothetical protein
VAGCCEHGYEPLGSIKGGEFVNSVSDCWVVKRTLFYVVSYVLSCAIGHCMYLTLV